MTGTGDIAKAALLRPAAMRGAGFLVLWGVLSGGAADLLPGVVAALAAVWLSLRLLPPAGNHLRLVPLLRFTMRFLGQSVLAGADVARRALDPALPLNPGLVRYPVRLSAGARRNTFTTLMSLLPGTVPVGEDQSGALVIHCLDTRQPVVAQLAAEEAMLAQIVGGTPIIARMSGDG